VAIKSRSGYELENFHAMKVAGSTLKRFANSLICLNYSGLKKYVHFYFLSLKSGQESSLYLISAELIKTSPKKPKNADRRSRKFSHDSMADLYIH
jgi:hypothetical protein